MDFAQTIKSEHQDGSPATEPSDDKPSDTAKEIPCLNIYYLLCYAWDIFTEKDTLADVDALKSTDLVNLFARVLVSGTRHLLRRGLDRGYQAFEDEISGVRGKLLVTQTLRHGLLRRGRAACSWDELEYDTPPNRIIKATLQSLLHEKTLNSNTRKDIHDLLRWLIPVQTVKLRAEHFRRVQLHRNNRIYALLLHVCEYVFEHWLPAEHGGARCFRDFVREGLPMLFQKFVHNFYKRELPTDWNVNASKIQWQIEAQNEDAKQYLPGMGTDICLRNFDRAIILDVKYYMNTLATNAFGQKRLHSGNLYQLFTYLRQQSFEPGWEHAEGILLYPRTTTDIVAEFKTHGHRIRALTLDLTQPWQIIHDALMQIVLPSPNACGY